MSHKCKVPKSADFRDGRKAEGCWTEKDGNHVEQVAGKSGVYLIVTDKAGNTIRDDRPWQMVNGVS